MRRPRADAVVHDVIMNRLGPGEAGRYGRLLVDERREPDRLRPLVWFVIVAFAPRFDRRFAVERNVVAPALPSSRA
jgi:hypothetical protein